MNWNLRLNVAVPLLNKCEDREVHSQVPSTRSVEMFELMVEESFDAAHALRGYEGPCENLHGHTWKVQVFFQGQRLNKIGLLEDFKVIKSKLREILEEFDHKLLNDVKPFETENPSSENLAKIIYKKIKKKTKMLNKVVVWESSSAHAAYWE